MTSPNDAPPPEDAPANAGVSLARDASGRFRKGQSGNPRGTPRGSRHWASRMAEALIDGEGDAIVRVTIQKALAGDDTALRICMDRLLPPRKDRPVRFDLPRIVDAVGLLQAHADMLRATADGEITLAEAREISALIEGQRRLYEMIDLADRIAAIERRLAGIDRPSPPRSR